MRVTVRRTTRALAQTSRDLQKVPVEIAAKGGALVHKNGDRANRIARSIAKKKAGPHGKDYFKRISAEMAGPLSVEVGPSPLVGTRYTGVGGTAGAGRDLDETLVKVSPKFGTDASKLMDGLL